MTTHVLIETASLSALTDEVKALRQAVEELRQPPKEWVTVNEYAAHYGVTADHVRRLIREGKLEARFSGKRREVRV